MTRKNPTRPDTKRAEGWRPEPDQADIFAFFNEIGIVSQLSTTLLASALPDGVHPSHFAIVNHLVRMGDGKTPAAIAAAMQVTKATMTHSIGVLTAQHFVESRDNPKDARSKTIHLTATGRKFRETAIGEVTRRFTPLFDSHQQAAMRQMLVPLREIRRTLDDNRRRAADEQPPLA